MTGFRLIVADLTGQIIGDARCDGDAIQWSGRDLPAARIALTAAHSVIVQMPAAWQQSTPPATTATEEAPP